MKTSSIDLSEHQAMIGQVFEPAEHPANLEWQGFDDKQLAFFQEQGYVKGGRVLGEAQLACLRSELETFFEPEHPGHEFWYEYHRNEATAANRVLFHALGAWRIAPGFHDLLWHFPWLGRASQLLGGSVRFWHDQLFCKPANDGGVVAWHQDYSYWTRTTPMAHLTCWIALDDATVENGCVHYVPGSHRWDLLPSTALAGDMEAITSVLDDDQLSAFRQAVPIELSAGECVFHHPLMVHGSYENQSATARRATVVNVFADGVVSATDDVLLQGVPPVAAGQAMSGRFFPLLHAAEPRSGE
ncbi:MAG: phytanoyl-CoA dioxygenase family protein [Pirellulaceae bacterium]